MSLYIRQITHQRKAKHELENGPYEPIMDRVKQDSGAYQCRSAI